MAMIPAAAKNVYCGSGAQPAIPRPSAVPKSVMAPRTPDTAPQLRRGTDSGKSA